jgi:hypothetical protein
MDVTHTAPLPEHIRQRMYYEALIWLDALGHFPEYTGDFSGNRLRGIRVSSHIVGDDLYFLRPGDVLSDPWVTVVQFRAEDQLLKKATWYVEDHSRHRRKKEATCSLADARRIRKEAQAYLDFFEPPTLLESGWKKTYVSPPPILLRVTVEFVRPGRLAVRKRGDFRPQHTTRLLQFLAERYVSLTLIPRQGPAVTLRAEVELVDREGRIQFHQLSDMSAWGRLQTARDRQARWPDLKRFEGEDVRAVIAPEGPDPERQRQ